MEKARQDVGLFLCVFAQHLIHQAAASFVLFHFLTALKSDNQFAYGGCLIEVLD